MESKIQEGEIKSEKLYDKHKSFLRSEKKYLEKINKQNDRMKVIKKLFDQQSKKNIELNEINNKLNNKLIFYISNGRINRDEFDDLIQDGLVDNKVADKIQKYLEIDEYEVKEVRVLSSLRLISTTREWTWMTMTTLLGRESGL